MKTYWIRGYLGTYPIVVKGGKVRVSPIYPRLKGRSMTYVKAWVSELGLTLLNACYVPVVLEKIKNEIT